MTAVRAGCITLPTENAATTINVLKNGVTVLTGTFAIDAANTVLVAESGTLSVTSMAAGDLITAAVTAAAGTGALGTGLFVVFEYDELPN